MPPAFHPSGSSIGRLTSLILCLVVIGCVAMIGGTGYLKYRMDRAESLLAAPDGALGSDQAAFDRLRRLLGYGGFLGLASTYAVNHDATVLATMKEDAAAADAIVARWPAGTEAEARGDVASIVALFDTALQKFAGSATPDINLTAVDLAPLYAAMPILDARIAAVNGETKLAAQQQTRLWGMLLTTVCWISLIVAAACSTWTYLTLRDKHAAPLRALAQSIQNMSRGDMRTAIWGVERQDMIGELARAVDLARYHFSHLPDLSLLSEQGPVRLRFEGGARSLFEAMMKAISGDSENIRAQAASLTDAVQQQKDSVGSLTGQVEGVLRNILHKGQDGDRQIAQAVHDMTHSAENLKNAHAHAADQLNRLIPVLQERATGLAEIAQITGRQAAQSLQALSASDHGMKANADQAKETLQRLSSTADDLGERLFGAINLLQASGKVLAETTAAIQSRLDAGGGILPAPAAASTVPPATDILRDEFERALNEHIKPQLQAMEQNLGAQIGTQAQAGIDHTTALAELTRADIARLDHKVGESQADPLPELKQQMKDHWQQIAAQIENARVSFDRAFREQVADRLSAFEQALAATRSIADTVKHEVAPAAAATLPDELKQQMQDHWYQMAAQIEATRAGLTQTLTEQIAGLESKLNGGAGTSLPAADYVTQRQIEQQTDILSELVGTLAALDAHMRQIQSEMHLVAARA